MNAAHASVIVASGMPLAPSWGHGPPRTRAVFAQAREAGSDPYEVIPGIVFPPKPQIAPEVQVALANAQQEDAVPGAQCAGFTLKGQRCIRKIRRRPLRPHRSVAAEVSPLGCRG
jgi:hypothetical protein